MNQMIKMIKQWVTPRKKPMVKFDVKQHEDGHHVDIRMSVPLSDRQRLRTTPERGADQARAKFSGCGICITKQVG